MSSAREIAHGARLDNALQLRQPMRRDFGGELLASIAKYTGCRRRLLQRKLRTVFLTRDRISSQHAFRRSVEAPYKARIGILELHPCVERMLGHPH